MLGYLVALRGGSWNNHSNNCRAAYRNSNRFQLVRVPDPRTEARGENVWAGKDSRTSR